LARYVTSFAVDPRETPRRDVVKATIKVKSRGTPSGKTPRLITHSNGPPPR
jgi:hypothetical protein